MWRIGLSLVVVLLVLACAPPTLSELPASQQRALGEAAVAEVCGYEVDVETPISLGHRYNLNIARQYLDEVVPGDIHEGQLSQYFTLETISGCAADLEWGGVNFDVQRLVKRLGTEAEVRAMLSRSFSIARACRFDGKPEGASFASTCHAMGFAE